MLPLNIGDEADFLMSLYKSNWWDMAFFFLQSSAGYFGIDGFSEKSMFKKCILKLTLKLPMVLCAEEKAIHFLLCCNLIAIIMLEEKKWSFFSTNVAA